MSAGILDALRVSGWAAALLLVATLAATPLARALRALRPHHPAAARITRSRRGLGIACAAIALVHGATVGSSYLRWSELWPAITGVPWLRSGALAAALLVPLLVTSFPPAVRALRVRVWKPLHRLAYLVGALVVHHVLLAPHAPRWWGLALAATLIGLAISRVPGRRGPAAETGPPGEP